MSALDNLAAGLAASGRVRESAQVLGAMAALFDVMAAPPSTITERMLAQIEAAVRSQLSQDAYVAAWNEGHARPLHDVMSRMLEALPTEAEAALA